MSGSGWVCAEDSDFGSTVAVDAGPEPWPDLREFFEKVVAGEVTPADAHGVLRGLPSSLDSSRVRVIN